MDVSTIYQMMNSTGNTSSVNAITRQIQGNSENTASNDNSTFSLSFLQMLKASSPAYTKIIEKKTGLDTESAGKLAEHLISSVTSKLDQTDSSDPASEIESILSLLQSNDKSDLDALLSVDTDELLAKLVSASDDTTIEEYMKHALMQ